MPNLIRINTARKTVMGPMTVKYNNMITVVVQYYMCGTLKQMEIKSTNHVLFLNIARKRNIKFYYSVKLQSIVFGLINEFRPIN